MATRWTLQTLQVTPSTNRNLDDIDHEDAAAENLDKAFAEETPINAQLSMPFPTVRNLDHVLPLTSTPVDDQVASSSNRRLSAIRPRGFLPMEMEDPQSPVTPRSRYTAALASRSDQVRRVLNRGHLDGTTEM